MSQAILKNTGQGTAELSGDLSLHSVAALASEGDIQIQAATTSSMSWQLDLQHVGGVSSAGVALFLGWMRLCVARKVTMSIINAPDDMRGILNVCNLNSVFEPILTDG